MKKRTIQVAMDAMDEKLLATLDAWAKAAVTVRVQRAIAFALGFAPGS